MSTILEAIYQEGILILADPLAKEQEGKKFKVILLEEEDNFVANKIAFFQFVDHHTFTLPPDYQFHREALYERETEHHSGY
jgi:predicted DNA-binding antitoxin AbrB/MazE fold protein